MDSVVKTFFSVSCQRFRKFRFKHDWIVPSGYDTGIRVHNRKTNQNVPLIFSNVNFVKWYICGPTVYDESHIGHASCYIRFDIIRRILQQHFNISPVIALGITDIDDKIIKRAIELKTDFKFLAKEYELKFLRNLSELNILPSMILLRVSDHIPEIINFISRIIERGHAYAVKDGSVYFNSESSDRYILLNSPEELIPPLKEGQKHHLDFALWKGTKPGEPYWESPWGKGRPGWHIECSAMASKVFGSNLDIHSGGIDLLFPHHSNEEIQSCSYHECDQWVNYWLYAGPLLVENKKMSKSFQNFISISDFLKTYTADHFRMFCFLSPYGKGLHYSLDEMRMAVSACGQISKFFADSNSYIRGDWTMGNVSESLLLQKLEETNKRMKENFLNDFNTEACFINLMDLIKTTIKMLSEENSSTSSRSPGAVAAVSNYVKEILKSFGFQFNFFDLSQNIEAQAKLEFVLNAAVNLRSEIRGEALSSADNALKQNLLQACDSFRSDLKTIGVTIKDQRKNNTSSWGIENQGKSVS